MVVNFSIYHLACSTIKMLPYTKRSIKLVRKEIPIYEDVIHSCPIIRGPWSIQLRSEMNTSPFGWGIHFNCVIEGKPLFEVKN